ncbi:putative multidrug export ATP-binding/permease protein [compost metagenome]
MRLSYLMEMVSFVFQDVFLFKQSIMDNIRIGNQKASDKEVIEAAKAAQCHEFIMKLPNGYNTVIGTKGVHLSGGERQRIVIARAIVKNAL